MAKSPAKRQHGKTVAVTSGKAAEADPRPDATPSNRKRPRSSTASPSTPNSSAKTLTHPQRANSGAISDGINEFGNGMLACCSPKSPKKRLFANSPQKPKWNPLDPRQMAVAKETFHVSTMPAELVCREQEQSRILDFCKSCIEQKRGGSLYVCGCPGTGKTLSMGIVKELLSAWANEAGFQSPDSVNINCSSLTVTNDIFSKILEKCHPRKKVSSATSHLQQLQNILMQDKMQSCTATILVIVDEMDYLITKDRGVLHDLFMLTTYPLSRIILIGIANAIDLADRFLPMLESLNCKPMVVTFCAYTRDQIIRILQQRLLGFGYNVFESLALEYCARKVAAASGDMRRALSICINAIEMLEVDLKCATTKQKAELVTFDHMELAVSKAFKSPIVGTIQALPQHQQIILCALVRLLRGRKNSTTLGDLNKTYSDICRSVQFPVASTTEFACMCKVLSDQGLIKLGQSREEKLKRVTLAIDCADISFSLKESRFFRNCLE